MLRLLKSTMLSPEKRRSRAPETEPIESPKRGEKFLKKRPQAVLTNRTTIEIDSGTHDKKVLYDLRYPNPFSR
jgi:hypothetical protein